MQVRSKHGGRVRSGLALLVLTLAALTLSPSADAQRDRRAGPSHRGDISRSHERDRHVWRGSRWSHDRHAGRLSWSLGIGGLWYPYPYPYAYPAPFYPYSYPWGPPIALASPPESGVPAAPPTQYWYFCEAANTYYPYVPTCPGGWKQVPATPSDASPVPQQ